MMRNRGVNDPTWRARRRSAPHSGSFTPRFPVSMSVTAKWAQNWSRRRPELLPSQDRRKIVSVVGMQRHRVLPRRTASLMQDHDDIASQ